MKKVSYAYLVLLSVLFISACGTTTSITGSYKAPGITQVSYKKIFVSALTGNNAAKQTVENGISQYLNSKGISAVKSMDVFPPEYHATGSDKDQAAVLKKIRESGCDGILTIALVNKETETRYVPGTNVYPVGGFGYYGRFGTYYGYGYNSFYSPGYYDTSKTYYIETNIYNAETEALVWSGQSKTYDPSSLDSFLVSYEKAITGQLVKDGLIISGTK